jgi:UDP-N-acetylmuramate dehydrogenase
MLKLRRDGIPSLRYTEIINFFEKKGIPQPTLAQTREAVLALRKSKSMVIDEADRCSRSVGSFFLNPVVSHETFKEVERRWRDMGDGTPVPSFPTRKGLKIPAAWLVEHSGFQRGYQHDGVGVSEHHALALVNYGGSAEALLTLASDIKSRIFSLFSIQLEIEPVIVPDQMHKGA